MTDKQSSFAEGPSAEQARLVATIRDELVDHWIADTPKRIPMLPVFGLLVVALLHDAVPTSQLAMWLFAVTLAAIWRYTVYVRYRRGGDGQISRLAAARSKGLFVEATLSVSVIGLVWGISMVFCHQYPVSAAVQSTIGIIAAGLGIVALSGMYPRAGIAMTVCIFLPFIVWALFNGDFQQLLLAAGSAMYIVPNAMNRYWSSTPTGNGGTVSKWVASFGGEGLFVMGKNNLTPVRLVRGAVWSGQRYLATSESYPGDGTNNAVVDRKTGLTWRRCLQGQTWNGGACIGVATTFTHEAALAHARAQARWRLPNIKELGSVMDLGRSNPVLDTTAFPGTSGEDSWSSTPLTHTLAGHAWYSSFSFGFVTAGARGSSYSVRLVLLD